MIGKYGYMQDSWILCVQQHLDKLIAPLLMQQRVKAKC